jgi:hypothetical protein
MYINGYHSGAIMKGVINTIYKFVCTHIDHASKNSKRITSSNDQLEYIKMTMHRLGEGELKFRNINILINSMDVQ